MLKIRSLTKGKEMRVSIPVNSAGALLLPQDMQKKDAFDERAEALTAESRYLLTDGIIIDPEDKVQEFFLKAAKRLKVLVDSKKEAERVKSALFYIENKEAEATDTLKEIEKQMEAQRFIMDASHEKKIELAALLGFSGRELTLTQLTANLYKIASTKPYESTSGNYQVILNLMKDPDYNFKLLLAYLIFDNVIRRTASGYMYNDTFIGQEKADVLEYMKNKVNSEVLDQWKYKYTVEKEVKNLKQKSK